MIRLIVLFVLFSAATLLAFKDHPGWLFNPPSILIVLIPALLAPLVAMGPKRCLRALRGLRSAGAEAGEPGEARRLLGVLGRTSLNFGVIMTVAGAILILGRLDPARTTGLHVCRAGAVALLTLLFGWLGKALCDALRDSIPKESPEREGNAPAEGEG